jgi:phosphinothricin acetyltransferase
MSAPFIRPAVDADLPAIAAIYGEAVRNGSATFEIDPPDVAEMTARWRRLVDAGHPWLVARDTDTVLGFAYAGPYNTRPAYLHTGEDSIYLQPAARGGGIGTALLTALIAEAQSRGFRQMIALIGDSANAPSIRLHARCGFQPVGIYRDIGWKHGRWVDVVMMQRHLGEGGSTPPGDRR